jgi:hypothetical protein
MLAPHGNTARRARRWCGGNVLLLLALLTACDGDGLYPEHEITGPFLSYSPVTLSLSAVGPPRGEFGDTVAIRVRIRHLGGRGTISRAGVTALVVNLARGDTTVVELGPSEVAVPASGTTAVDFPLVLGPSLGVPVESLPESLLLEFHAFALADDRTCVAAVAEQEQQLPCVDFRGSRIASTSSGSRLPVVLVPGRTLPVPAAAAAVGDIAIDPFGQRLYLSNRTAHRVEVLDLQSLRFQAPVAVGSEPWGLGMNRLGDTLIVANSGGANVSFIPTGTLREDVSRRLEIPRVTLYEIEVQEDSLLGTRYTDIVFHNYADRPQFIAQDAGGRLLYSTTATRAAPEGTIRVADWQPGWESWDVRMLFHERALVRDTSWVAIANADTVYLAGPQQVIIVDHVPGSLPQVPLVSGPLPIAAAVAELRAQGSDVVAYMGARWRLPESVELSDTTFVAVSGDRRWVAFGEGIRTPGGRVVMWSAEGARLSQVEDIADLVNNTSDMLTGIDLNGNGSLGVARGSRGAYFFGPDLRLQGSATQSPGTGAALLPGSTTNRTLSFVPTAQPSIQIIETTHYTVIGEVAIRDALAGPFRVAPPAAGSQACPPDYRSGPPGCVLARVFGIGASGGLLTLDLLRSHVD